MELNDKKFAVLVDADNISHRKIKDILQFQGLSVLLQLFFHVHSS